MKVDLSVTNPAPYFTYDFHQRYGKELDKEKELTLISEALAELGYQQEAVAIVDSGVVGKLSAGRVVNLQTGAMQEVSAQWKDISYVMPFSQPDSNLIFDTKSMGVPALDYVALSNSPMASVGTELHGLRGVLTDLASKGTPMLLRELKYKYAVVAHALSENPILTIHPLAEENPSRSVIAFTYSGEDDLRLNLANKGYVVDAPNKGNVFTISNFPTHSKEQFEQLSDVLIDVI